ncbi:hypothetical protein ACQPYA_06780 [Micromonospora sp. CA-263727]|uniref:hypothetical protein n=1 Tax=Micromonospora sp. CA-263727 TaxID=3239967 RepID=UPI003D8E9030
MSDPEGRFEERLLTELKTVVAARHAAAATPTAYRPAPWWFGWRARLAALGAAVATAAVALPLALNITHPPQASTTPGSAQQAMSSVAYTVDVEADGSVTVRINQMRDAEGLERRLAEAGIPAKVDYVPAGKVCTNQPRYTHAPESRATEARSSIHTPMPSNEARLVVDFVDEIAVQDPGVTVFAVKPGVLRDGETLVLELSMAGNASSGTATGVVVGYGVAQGPVRPCELGGIPQ